MDDPEQVEYVEEIADMRRRLTALEEAGGDPELVEEYAIEVELLEALLIAAQELRAAVAAQPELAEQLLLRGFAPTNFQDVYSFVYDSAMEIESSGRELAQRISRTDFATLLT